MRKRAVLARKAACDSRLNDLEALRAISQYLCEEATRLQLDTSWSLAMLPEAIDREIEQPSAFK